VVKEEDGERITTNYCVPNYSIRIMNKERCGDAIILQNVKLM
jgi:hypothetical protein